MADPTDIKRGYNRGKLVSLARELGLKVFGGSGRFGCPLHCCSDPRACSPSESADGAVYCCHHCQLGGSAIDLVMAVQGLDFAAAVEFLADQVGLPSTPAAPPVLKDAAALWHTTSDTDDAGMAYLKGRRLERAVELGFARFATGTSGDAWVDSKAKAGYRVCVPLFDFLGALRSFQLRSIKGEAKPAKLTCANTKSAGLFFGAPLKARDAATVYVCEGMADTLAVQLAAAGLPDSAVVGVPGVDQVARIVELAGDARGRTFVLFPQNDDEHEKSAKAFEKLQELLEDRGAHVRTLQTPEAWKDPADWWKEIGLLPIPLTPVVAPSSAPATDGALAKILPLPQAAPQPLRNSYASLCQILRTPALRRAVFGEGEVEYDEMKDSVTIGRDPIRKEHVSRAREMLEVQFSTKKGKGLAFKGSDIEMGLHQVGKERPFHSVREYLEGLHWDGVKRLNTVAERYLAQPFDEPRRKLNHILLRRWAISAVARALHPGCKVDTALVLTGAQGVKKSTFFKTLASVEWFSDSMMDIRNKESYVQLRGVWIYEWAEMTAARVDVESVRAFLSSTTDRFIPKYERLEVQRPRSCVIVGTTNELEFLSDPAGHRRFWPIEVLVEGKIDAASLALERDQIWAEAKAALEAGEKVYLTEEEEALLKVVHFHHEKQDPWEDYLAEWLVDKERSDIPITTANLLEKALRISSSQMKRSDEMRVAACMKRMGWKNVPTGAERQRRWVNL